MLFHRTRASVIPSAFLAAAFAASAHADFAAQFDTYSSGTILQAVDGWHGWDNNASVAGLVSNDFSVTGANSIRIQGYTDAVHEFDGVTSGDWTISTKQFIPSAQSGQSYFILMNRYADGGNNDSGMWSTQLRFNLGDGQVYDDFRGGAVAIATDQWVDLSLHINLDANTVQTFYNNQLLSSGNWTTSGSSSHALAAVDLYSADGNRAYYDSINLTAAPSGGGICLAIASLVVGCRRKR